VRGENFQNVMLRNNWKEIKNCISTCIWHGGGSTDFSQWRQITDVITTTNIVVKAVYLIVAYIN